MPAFWGYPQLLAWLPILLIPVGSQVKTRQKDKVKVTNLKNLPKLNYKFINFVKWIRQVLLREGIITLDTLFICMRVYVYA